MHLRLKPLLSAVGAKAFILHCPGWLPSYHESRADLTPLEFFTSIKYFNGYPIFFDVTTIEHVLVENMPPSWSGEARILIFANITLAMREAPNYSIPDAPKESFFEAKLNTLYDTCILFEVGEISPIRDLKDLRVSLTSMSSLIDAGFDAEEIDHLTRLVREMEGLDQRVLDYPVVINGKKRYIKCAARNGSSSD